MLFAYTYVPHKMEKMQRYVNYIFYQVWCRARKAGAYDLSLFDENSGLKEVMTSFAYDHTKEGDKFSTQVQAIYESFAKLSRQEIAQFKRWYQANNNIPKICANNPKTELVRYADIAVNQKALSDQLGIFFKGLYSQSLLDLVALRAKIGDIDDHYQIFMETNNAGKCPFCGINDLLGEYHSKREAYDHYLPKAIYPFNSINFKNLVPACHHCNSSYKTTKDPAYTPKDPARLVHRRAVFYPYSTAPHTIDITVELNKTDVANLTPADINLQFGPAAVNEQIETWKDVYGIEERYKAKLCGENDGKYWLIQVLDEWKEDGREPAQFIRTLTRQAQKKPFAECNFLKKPFLDACQTNGLFDVLAPVQP
ncbi:HNH endonuclease [Nitrincola iocasae]|uniref:HNH nuclease domain-containing protein n=1 Tax=Nitrincola iocasae TaxID=2614693 RepID=A0A5J6L9U2_9GAMM|nr:hypothetical protein [Nitrincola iocasae]QEW05141.1 hypothetical protein F5I99_00730 [Nitrincola iocasae]